MIKCIFELIIFVGVLSGLFTYTGLKLMEYMD